jgi:hypothetical protein
MAARARSRHAGPSVPRPLSCSRSSHAATGCQTTAPEEGSDQPAVSSASDASSASSIGGAALEGSVSSATNFAAASLSARRTMTRDPSTCWTVRRSPAVPTPNTVAGNPAPRSCAAISSASTAFDRILKVDPRSMPGGGHQHEDDEHDEDPKYRIAEYRLAPVRERRVLATVDHVRRARDRTARATSELARSPDHTGAANVARLRPFPLHAPTLRRSATTVISSIMCTPARCSVAAETPACSGR